MIRAGRAAADLSFADVLAGTGVAVSAQQRIEALDEIIRREPGQPKVPGCMDAAGLDKIVALIEKRGFRLIPKTARSPARIERVE